MLVAGTLYMGRVCFGFLHVDPAHSAVPMAGERQAGPAAPASY